MKIYIFMEAGDGLTLKAFKNDWDADTWWTEYNGKQEGDIYEVELE